LKVKLPGVRIPLSPLKSIKLGSPKTRKPANTEFAGFLVFKITPKYSTLWPKKKRHSWSSLYFTKDAFF
jgi:hypothetical protein